MDKINNGKEIQSTANASADSIKIEPLISNLDSQDKDVYKQAYKSLLEIGQPATKYLVEALADPKEKIRREVNKLLDEARLNWVTYADSKTVSTLVGDLCSSNDLGRVGARRALVLIGKKAVKSLIQALSSPSQVQRWEAAKALSQIGDPASIEALLNSLTDNNFDIRWLAAEGLIFIGEPTIKPLLHELVKSSDSEWLREGAHHILYEINKKKPRKIIKSVLQAIIDVESRLETPLAAESALNALNNNK